MNLEPDHKQVAAYRAKAEEFRQEAQRLLDSVQPRVDKLLRRAAREEALADVRQQFIDHCMRDLDDH